MKKLVPLFALLLAALALAACGGGDDTTSEDSATAPETMKEAEREKEAEGGPARAATLEFEADPSGTLAFTTDEVTGKAGKVTVTLTNQSAVPHDVAIENEAGETVAITATLAETSGSTNANLKPGDYTFFCSVPGHRQAGMEGTLTVK